MRRTLTLFLGLLAVGSVAASARPPSDERTSSFARDGVRWDLRARPEPCDGPEGGAVRLAVLRGGRPIPPRHAEGARLCGVGGAGAFEVRTFPDDGPPAGWIVEARGTAHAGERRVVLVVPPAGPAPSEALASGALSFDALSFDALSFDATESPVVRHGEDAVEVWSRRRWWRSAAPGASVVVPEVRVVAGSGAVREGTLDPDWSRWPAGFTSPSFPAAFSAGLLQENPDLMERALDRLLSPEDLPACEALGLPTIPGALADVVCAVDRLALARRHLARVTEPLSVTPPPPAVAVALEK